MQVDERLLKDVARVSRLELTDAEIQQFVPELKEILGYFEALQQVPTEGVKPSFHPIDVRNNSRDDVPHAPLSQKDALKNAIYTKEGYFKGPRAI